MLSSVTTKPWRVPGIVSDKINSFLSQKCSTTYQDFQIFKVKYSTRV